MAKKKKISGKTQTRWEITDHIHQKVSVYKSLHKLDSLESAANILLDKATADIKLPG